MGLFSSKKSITETTQNFDTTNVSLSELEDSVAFAGIRDSDIKLTITETDQGAIDAAASLAAEGLDVVGDAFSENVDALGDVIDLADASNERTTNALLEGQEDAFQFGLQSQAFSQEITAESIGLVDDLASRSIDSIESIASDFGAFTAGQSTELRNAIGDIQARESGNTDARLGDITRVALIVAGGVAVIAIAVPLLTRKKRGR